MRIDVRYRGHGTADGVYRIRASGCLVASLHWANADGALPDWTALAYVPLGAQGAGEYELRGGRDIPPEATHLLARAVSPDFTTVEEAVAEIPVSQKKPAPQPDVRFCLMSDLHLASKPGRIRFALRRAARADCILLAGDITNDGKPEQFELFRSLIEEECEGVPVFSVTGNHDQPVYPLPLIEDGTQSYPSFQGWLLRRAQAMGVYSETDSSGAYRAVFRGVSIYGLQAVSHYRRFVFREGRQLQCLDTWLEQDDSAYPRLILCHAPLAAHNPMCAGEDNPENYLSRNKALQEIVDRHGHIAFLSGHTHVTLNEACGCVEWDEERRNLYVNDSSICPTTFHRRETLGEREWVDGAMIWMDVSREGAVLKGQTLSSCKWIARGYYCCG